MALYKQPPDRVKGSGWNMGGVGDIGRIEGG